MGIRFICPVCEKRIHVKSFLAGKRGICPKCGGKVEIPSESQPTGNNGESAGPPVPPGGYQPVAVPTSEPAPVAANVYHPTVTPVAVSSQAVPAPVAYVGANAGGLTQPIQSLGPAPVAPAGMTQAVVQPVQQVIDPLLEAPNAKWYVRPPSGGQFGPATAEPMRRWLAEGRVSGEALVWREGWADWKKASTVFPEIGETTPTQQEPVVANMGPAIPAASSGSARPYRRRRSSSGLAIGMVITLSILAIGLLVGFMIVVLK